KTINLPRNRTRDPSTLLLLPLYPTSAAAGGFPLYRFSFGRQSSLGPIRRSPIKEELLAVPENLDCTMQLLFMASRGDARGVEDLFNEGIDVNSIDLNGRTALHIAACKGHAEVVKLLLSRRANIDARDRWGSNVSPLLLPFFVRLFNLGNGCCFG
ncbi:unnamed protein product, partial [Linum tenue]